MIKIRRLQIREFRGIRYLELDLNQKSVGIYGPNGSGKSGVVDAIEFCFTGTVDRFSGVGTGNVRLSTHGPHVDKRSSPSDAVVEVVAVDSSSGREFTIRRSVGDPSSVTVTPDNHETSAAIGWLEACKGNFLTRREIIKFILAQGNDRSVQVQELLRLESLETLRKSLVRFHNSQKNELTSVSRATEQAKAQFLDALGTEDDTDEAVLVAVNQKRALLDLDPLQSLTEDTRLDAGLKESSSLESSETLNRAHALNAIRPLKSLVENGESEEVVEHLRLSISEIGEIIQDQSDLDLAVRSALIEKGLEFVTSDECPLCDTPWKAEELREHLREKLAQTQELNDRIQQLNETLSWIRQNLSQYREAASTIVSLSDKYELAPDARSLADYEKRLQGFIASIQQTIDDPRHMMELVPRLRSQEWLPVLAEAQAIHNHYAGIAAIEPEKPEGNARQHLWVAQDRFRRYWDSVSDKQEQSSRCGLAEQLLDRYVLTLEKTLTEIYDSVAADFARYYESLNHSDEIGFQASLDARPTALDLNVDFHNRGKFPPSAYHSEGHQDAMGLCLHLALMKRVTGDDFTFAVLDDVLMSIDTGHRRDVCRLLTREFPKTQFVMTTHDQVWHRYMKTDGLTQLNFSLDRWTVDTGPITWEVQDPWQEIAHLIDENEVPKAAATLRRFLEFVATTLADNLRAPIRYRADGAYDLGDLLQPSLKELQKRLGKGEDAARKWGDQTRAKELRKQIDEMKKLITQVQIEQWAINKAVHYHEWANFQPKEFRAVSDAFQHLFYHLKCKNCLTYPYLLPAYGEAESLRCTCGTTNINLKRN